MNSDQIFSPQRQSSRMDILRYIRLVWRLLTDRRISPWLKALIPALALAYILMPLDLIADVIPVLGQLDDLAILLLGLQLFIKLCPQQIVREHLQGGPTVADSSLSDEDVIDATYRLIEEE